MPAPNDTAGTGPGSASHWALPQFQALRASGGTNQLLPRQAGARSPGPTPYPRQPSVRVPDQSPPPCWPKSGAQRLCGRRGGGGAHAKTLPQFPGRVNAIKRRQVALGGCLFGRSLARAGGGRGQYLGGACRRWSRPEFPAAASLRTPWGLGLRSGHSLAVTQTRLPEGGGPKQGLIILVRGH